LFEVSAGVDERGEAETQHGCVVGVQQQSSVDDVEKQRQISGVCYRARHSAQHVRHQLIATNKTIITPLPGYIP